MDLSFLKKVDNELNSFIFVFHCPRSRELLNAKKQQKER